MTGILNLLMGTVRSAVVTDPYFEYTTLLLPGSGTNGAQNNSFVDSSANAFPITRNPLTGPNAPTQGTFSPFSQTGWSGYFDGTTDIVSTPTGQTNLTLGTSDFTIEGWFYIGAQVQTDPALFTSDPGIGLANTIMIQFGSSTLKAPLFVNNVHLTASSTNNYLVSNQWNHIAVCRTGGSTYSYYINGVAVDNVASNSTSLTTNSWRVGYWTVGANAFTGNISNFRIIKGTALYSGATITVPTAPLTAVANTQLLILQDNRFIDRSPNNYTLTITGDVRVTPFSPFNPTASWSAATNGGSGYFDGSGDFLTGPTNNSAFDFGSGLFTIEFWIYPVALSTIATIVCSLDSATGSALAFGVQVLTDGSVKTLQWGGSSYFLLVTSATGVVKLNAWNHVAVVRSGANFGCFVNGNREGSSTTISGTQVSNATLNIGRDPYGSGSLYPYGYLSSLRVVKGSAVYDPTQTSITVPTAPLTAITNTSLLLNFTNAGIYDATSKNDLETVGDAQISNAVTPKWGSTSIKFDGTGDYLRVPDSPLFSMGSGNFTIDGWVYRSGSGAVQIICCQGGNTGSSTSFGLQINSSNQLSGFVYSGTTLYITNSTATVSANQWVYVAMVRDGNTITLYINGSADGTVSVTGVSVNDSAQPLGIGTYGDTVGAYFNGYIQDLRITRGYARTITTPTAAFPTL